LGAYHVKAIPWRISSNDINLLIRIEPNDVFQGDYNYLLAIFIKGIRKKKLTFLIWHHTTATAAGPAHDLEIDQVNVHGMGPAASTVLENPVLNGTACRFCEDALFRTISPGDAVDLPLATLTLELELVFDSSVGRWEWHIAEFGGKVIVLVRIGNSVSDNELHDFVGVEVVGVVGHLLVAPQCHVAVLVGAEIDNDLPSFSHGDIELGCIDRVQKEASVRPDNLEVDPGADLCSLFEVQLERAANGSIQETEAILAWLDLEVRPRLSIDVDDIAEEIGSFTVSFRRPEGAVRVVSLGGQAKWNVVISLR